MAEERRGTSAQPASVVYKKTAKVVIQLLHTLGRPMECYTGLWSKDSGKKTIAPNNHSHSKKERNAV